MFWKLSFRQPSAIDALLEKEDCTLSEILDEDDVLQECKTHNKKLIDFLIRPEILEELVRMTCEEPAEDAEEKVKFKYPHLACELLTAEVYTIVEKLSSSESLLQLLWSFLDSSSPLDPLVGSFISKVLAMLLNKENINSVIMDFVKSREDFISQFLNHLGTSAMMDLLLQMVAAPENDKNRIELAEWLRDQGIVERLVDLVGNEAGSEQCVNASVALCEMIRLSRESYQMSNPAPLHTKLESEETMKRLLANMFSCEHPSDVVIVNGISVLLTALERRPNNPAISPAGPGGSYFNQPPEETQMESVIQPIGLESVLAVILPHLKDFHKLLSRTPEIGLMHTTVGILDPPLGNTRLQVVRLISAVLQCSSTSIATEVIRLQTFTNLLDLFFAYPWNNFLHMTVESCIMAALFTVPPPLSSTSSSSLLASGGTPAAASQEGGEVSRSDEGEGANGDGQENSSVNVNHKSLRHHLLIDCQLVSRLLGGAEKNEEASSKPQGCRQGYMGHLVRIANSVARSGDSDEQLREILKSSLDEQTQQRWNNFINGSLADMNKKNETNLGGNRPMLADDSDEEFDPVGGIPTDSELDKAYQQFIDVKYTSPIMDDYGVEDELNPPEAPFEGSFTRLMDISLTVNADEEQTQAATIFDTACTERIQQFDDAESDDDDSSTWNDKEISFVSPVEQENRSPRSMSSGEDEELRREIQTGSGDDEDRAAVYTASTVSQITSKKDVEPDRMEIDNTFGGVLSWRSDIATAEDLSGVSAMDTGGDWTKEPDSPNSGDQQQSPRSNWADFNAAFGSKDNNSPQDMDLEPTSSGTHSHITVTYLSRTSQESPFSEGDDDLMDSPQRRAGYNYSPLSPDQDQASPLNIDSIEVSVGGNDSSDEENNTSSDSDEERSGKYTLNTSTGSDGDLLLNSPGRNTDISQRENSEAKHDTTSPNTPSTSHDPTATPSSNGLEAATTLLSSGSSPEEQRKVVLNSNENNCTKNMDSHTSSNSGCNSEAGSSGEGKVNNKERLPDGEVGSEELQDNFKFLSKGMLSSEDGSKNKDGLIAEQSRLIEQKRAEAQEVCEQFEKVQKQDS